VPSPTSSSIQAARQRLADQLREVRQNAGLTGRKLAELAGWHGVSKVSKIEHGVRPISVDDLHAWCRVCGVSAERTEELLAELRATARMWTSYRRINSAGMRAAQASVRQEYEETYLRRVYQSRTVPGLLQTAEFTYVALVQARLRQGAGVVSDEDLTAAVEERMDRQRVLREGRHRFMFVVEEAVLHYRLCPPPVHAGQLAHLLEVMHLPSVSFGVIPLTAERERPRPVEGFTMADDREVAVELVSGYLTITTPSEVAAYAKEFAELSGIAAYGTAARRLIVAALEALDTY
jgi:transcriptional regulator with XRE-family HTH domain